MSLDLWIIAGVVVLWLLSGPVTRLVTGRSERTRRRRNYGRISSRTSRPSVKFSVNTGRA